MGNFIGVIIEESLEDKSVLDKVKITSTKVEPVIERHKTPWLKQWTLHTVEINSGEAEAIAQELSKALENKHSWYVDFKNEKIHYIIYKNKVFHIDRSKIQEYQEATKYGISIGIPDYQVDFEDSIPKWER